MVGYSGTPLAMKLGIKPGHRVWAKGAPKDYPRLLAPLPEGVKLMGRAGKGLDLIHFFTRRKAELAAALPRLLSAIQRDGTIWISWPKQASKVETDLTEDVVRKLALPLGLVDVKVCAVDEVWSGLKLVIRKTLR
ncbi:MAG TPA: DUF3052 domain-containing protein [Gammaproteobacteria bacterium]